jgi:hypothetical protein
MKLEKSVQMARSTLGSCLALLLVVITVCGIEFAPVQAGFQLDNTPTPFPTSSDPSIVDASTVYSNSIFLPNVIKPSNFMMLGVYISGYAGSQSVIDTKLKTLDNWTGKKHSIVGLWVDLKDGNPAYNINTQLETLYQNGYTAFMNLQASNTSMAQIANGSIDSYIHNTARAFASWANKGGTRIAFIAPFTEMNGAWATYGGDPANFKIGYKRVRDIFLQEGAPPASMRWVFGPNGWSTIPFESYYPGDNVVDINGLSSYNYGYCAAIHPWEEWKSPVTIYDQYITRMAAMAPSKPIFIAQTATSGINRTGSDPTAKNQWLSDALNYLAGNSYVQAIIYVNLSLECDWPIYNPPNVLYDGYRLGAQNPSITYKSPSDIMNLPFHIGP